MAVQSAAYAPVITNIGLGGANGQSGWSAGNGASTNYSLGGSASQAYTNSDSWNNAYGYTDSWGQGEGWSKSWNQGEGWNNSWNQGEGWSDSTGAGEGWTKSWGNESSEGSGRTYGREASAKDIENAAIANAIQRNMWQEQAAYNAKQAEIDRNWQAEMSNTAYQRAVADLLKAGLNPILAVNSMGASTPSGAMASAGLASSAKANAYAESTNYSRSSGSSGSYSYNYNRNKSNSYNYSKGGSDSYNYSKGGSDSYNYTKNGSKSENWSQGQSTTRSRENSSSWNKSKGQSYNNSSSQWNNNVREITQAAAGTVKQMVNQGTNAAKKITDKAIKAYENVKKMEPWQQKAYNEANDWKNKYQGPLYRRLYYIGKDIYNHAK